MVILSVDYGDVRTGIAVCDKNEILAYPVKVITETDRARLAEQILSAAEELKAELIVVGLPVNMDGSQGFRADACRELADELKNGSSINVEMYDERLTTVSAGKALNATDTRGKKRKSVIDAVSAVIILEDYLRYRKNK
ncbi:MAG: Holliday junction resolvase RuvX [Clostridiales bacterium]|nr:Holliday junction resolvase RuvX [Clostridiales bacterium]MCD7827384.1 Holliday junction resolvase RuvX [Clostridiales bacterium]